MNYSIRKPYLYKRFKLGVDNTKPLRPWVGAIIHSRWTLLVMVASLACASIGTLVLISHAGVRMVSQDAFVNENVVNIKYELTRFYTGFARLAYHDAMSTTEAVWQHLRQANSHVQALQQSADGTQSGPLPLVDAQLRDIADQTQARIAALEQSARERLEDERTEVSVSAMDRGLDEPPQEIVEQTLASNATLEQPARERFEDETTEVSSGVADRDLDELFAGALEAAQALEARYRDSMNQRVSHYRSLSYGLGAILFVFAFVVALRTYFYELNRNKTYSSLRRREMSLRQSEQSLASLVETMGDWVWEVDSKGTYTYASANVANLLGYRADEILGRTPSVVTSEDGSKTTTELLAKNVRARQPFSRLEVTRVHKNGHKLVCETSAIPVFGVYGNYLGYIGVDRDVTERKHAEAQLKTQATELAIMNKELESFSYSVSHDLRAPLRAIGGFSQALLEDYWERLDETGKDYLRRVHAASHRMSELIEDLLMLCKVTRREMRFETVNLSTMATEIAAELEHSDPQRSIALSIQKDLWVCCDRKLLRIVVANLLSNAFKYTAREDRARVELGIAQPQGRRVFFVRDNGVGFDEKYMYKLFQPFQRLHGNDEFEGTGIGLATVARIIQRHQGKVWAEAKVDQGATFYFSLPEKPKNVA